MHLHFEKNVNTKSDCSILCLSWMGKVPDDIPDDDGWKLNRTNYYQEGWLATGNVRGIVGVTFTTSNMKKKVDFPLRTNYNLRGHRSDVILVKWNEPYQKLASCDSSGIIFVWIKYEGRWSIELINDRNTPVTYFAWSHDGRMALICYQDGFVLVGSVAGQRYWSSMLNLESIITCGIWTPDDQQVYFGTTHGQVIVMDVHGAMVSQVQLFPSVGIMSMAWSCEKFKMEEEDDFEPVERMFILAVSFLNGFIYLLKSYDDLSPAQINTGLNGSVGFLMDWSNSTQLLAVAGASQNPMSDEDSSCTQMLSNHLRFYTGNGTLIYSSKIPNASTTVSALTWGHNDKRLFIATGSQIHIAWVSSHIASLQLLCRLEIQNKLSSEIFLDLLPLPSRIKSIIGNLFARTIPCCVPESKTLREYVSRPPVCSKRLHCTMIRHDDDLSISSGTCYTLYLEFLGGLVPLLKGKRTSKLRPEFVIFDPQIEDPSLFMEFFHCPKDFKGSHNTVKDQCQKTESSDSELGGRFYNSPTPSRNKKINTNGKSQVTGENFCADTESLEELSYLDTLPEHVKLVEVTSNIWGTKFKIHGLAKTVPANLGQVTYKTSLLHLQPRQMTLVITELSDDCSTEPDPTFNPNIFSEDEDDQAIQNFLGTTQKIDPRQINDISPAIAPMSPQHNRYTSRSKQPSILRPGTSIGVCSLSHQESYDDDLLNGIEFRDMFTNQSSMRPKNLESSPNNTILPCPNYAGHATQSNRVSSNPSCQSKYAVSPLCFEGSVPTLQSPKNAVAPSDIIFDRPPTRQTSLMSFSSNTEYGKNLTHVKNVILPEQQRGNNSHVHSLSLRFNELNERVDLSKQILYKTNEMDLWTKDDYKLAPSVSNQTMNHALKMKRSCSVGYLDYVTRTASEVASILMKETANKRLVLVNKKLHKKKKLYQEDSRFSNLQKSGKSRSLDSCDIPATSVSKLRSACKDVDKHMNRLNRISENNVVGHKSNLCLKLQTNCDGNTKLHSPWPKNTHSGKSCSSLSYSEASKFKQNTSSSPNACLPNHVHNNVIERIIDKQHSSNTSDSLTSEILTTHFNERQREYESKINLRGASFSRKDNQHIVREKSIFNSDKENSSTIFNNHEQSKQVTNKQEDLMLKTEELTTPKTKIEAIQVRPVDAKTFLSLHAQAITTLENIISRLKDLDERCVTLPATLQRQSHSLPASPTPNKKGTRNQSASPIRQILKSPLLNRRQRKKTVEILGNKSHSPQYSAAETGTSVPQYQGLESFQKSQLRQKLLRSNIEPKASVCTGDVSFSRRKFVMHNKAPLWNENSQVYQLDFGGRVTQESAKNFQIEFRGKQVLQFGRIDGNAYTLDFQYPFSALQAFAVALANITQRLK